MTVEEIKQEICEVGHRLYDHGFVAANDGNISVKVGPNEYYCTPTGVSKGSLTPDMIIKIDGRWQRRSRLQAFRWTAISCPKPY